MKEGGALNAEPRKGRDGRLGAAPSPAHRSTTFFPKRIEHPLACSHGGEEESGGKNKLVCNITSGRWVMNYAKAVFDKNKS